MKPKSHPKKEKKQRYYRLCYPLFGWLTYRPPYFVLTRRIKKLLDLKKGDVVLETHAGAVPHYKLWKAAVGKEGRIVATDIDQFIVRTAKKIERLYTKKKDRTEIKEADAEGLPFEKETFDKMIVVLPELSDFMFMESFRVLKPHGKAIILYMPTIKLEKEIRECAELNGFRFIESDRISRIPNLRYCLLERRRFG